MGGEETPTRGEGKRKKYLEEMEKLKELKNSLIAEREGLKKTRREVKISNKHFENLNESFRKSKCAEETSTLKI